MTLKVLRGNVDNLQRTLGTSFQKVKDVDRRKGRVSVKNNLTRWKVFHFCWNCKFKLYFDFFFPWPIFKIYILACRVTVVKSKHNDGRSPEVTVPWSKPTSAGLDHLNLWKKKPLYKHLMVRTRFLEENCRREARMSLLNYLRTSIWDSVG